MRKKIFPLRITMIVFSLAFSGAVLAQDIARFNELYENLVRKYWHSTVLINGIATTVFDYQAMQREAGPLMGEIITVLDQIDPSKLKKDSEIKAFWINVYNFTAMRMVVDVYPVDSITSFKISLISHPWSKKSIRVGGRWYTLSQIEKDVLLQRFNDPRIVFAVNCAAVSCPDRPPEIFESAWVDSQIDDRIRDYFRNTQKGLWLERETKILTLAWILKKDRDLFPEGDTGLINFVSAYLDKSQQAWLANNEVTIKYFDHDWTLNDLAQADIK